jgi:acyl-CoA synthetase (AMP-forming)/AMP-acid ligase II
LDPGKIVQAIRQENVTNSFGSPTLWGKIAAHCRSCGMSLPSLRRVLCAGAAVPATLWENSRTLLPNGMLHSPYGATEALPIATISSAEIEPFSLRGACVGRLVGDVEVKIIAIIDGPISTWSDARELPAGEIGEIIVRGPVVTKIYDAMPDATLAAKILDGGNENPDSPGAGSRIASIGIPTSSVWHRMGDCGFRGIDGRLWFCGRKSERVQTASGTLHTEPCEQVFRQHPRAARCALVGIGEPGCQTPALIVETRVKDVNEARTLARELRALAMRHAHTSGIARFHFRARFPVDVRHNAKIHRLALAKWAQNAKAFEPEPDATAGRSDK